jgi:hypothetical protein
MELAFQMKLRLVTGCSSAAPKKTHELIPVEPDTCILARQALRLILKNAVLAE